MAAKARNDERDDNGSDNGKPPEFGLSKLMDFELEMAFFIGLPSKLGQPVSIDRAQDYIFGMVLMNDWSARDIQKWNTNLFLFVTFAFNILEEMNLSAADSNPTFDQFLKPSTIIHGIKTILKVLECEVYIPYMYWTMKQQLAHHTITGCNLNTGDLMASGTISGPTPDSYGSLLELTWRGSKPITLADGQTRTFLKDGDEVIITGYCQANNFRIGFGSCSGKLLPAVQL
ncbi:fumarylacetoacetase-like [Centruroides sculpturatus]|uniref:fumarylacetoacetase-like n=1 Tax=Centruroides sculpturatus TaxID=218467 RepID=UPI000C6D0603|nr:fumarylacetoacetase-like [Centruroides sculpturatus]